MKFSKNNNHVNVLCGITVKGQQYENTTLKNVLQLSLNIIFSNINILVEFVSYLLENLLHSVSNIILLYTFRFSYDNSYILLF